MGREVRKVPKDWKHPTCERTGRHKPVYDGRDFHSRALDWLKECAEWEQGKRPEYAGDDAPRYYWDWDGMPPSAEDYMLVDVPEFERTHYMLYETTSQGTPCCKSPVFETMDQLLDWAAENATVFAGIGATREEWSEMLVQGLVGAKVPLGNGVTGFFC